MGDDGDWFGDGCARKVGAGDSTLFWDDTWIGIQPLKEVFPRLFLISNPQGGCVAEFGRWADGVWQWDLRWRRGLFVWEEALVEDMLRLLQSASISHEEDFWVWLGDPSGMFSVRSVYARIMEGSQTIMGFSDDRVSLLGRLWRSLAPPKVIVFSWQLLLDRIPTRGNLLRRKVILDPTLAFCIICGEPVETALHLFLRCHFAHKVWYVVFQWLGWQLPLPPDLFSLFSTFCEFGRGPRMRQGLSLIWHSVLWFLWDMRNGCIFHAKVPESDSVVQRIKSISWQWFLARSRGSKCLYYEWHADPILCISRK